MAGPVSGPAPAPLPAGLAEDIAAASRILEAQGVVDGMGHVSVRVPGAPDRFAMPRALAPGLTTPDDIMQFDLDSVACGDDPRRGFLERFIHGEIYRARPDVMAIVHSHSPSVIPFGLTPAPMRAMFHNAGFLAKGVPVHDIRHSFGTTDLIICDCLRGADLAVALGQSDVVLMRAHGSVATGHSLPVAVFRAVYTEVNARISHWTHALAGAGSGDIAALSADEGALADVQNEGAALRAWELWRSRMRQQTGW